MRRGQRHATTSPLPFLPLSRTSTPDVRPAFLTADQVLRERVRLASISEGERGSSPPQTRRWAAESGGARAQHEKTWRRDFSSLPRAVVEGGQPLHLQLYPAHTYRLLEPP